LEGESGRAIGEQAACVARSSGRNAVPCRRGFGIERRWGLWRLLPQGRNRGAMSSGWINDYAGDVGASEAYEILGHDPRAQLVDVRTKPEWSFVGVPDLGALGRDVILVEWQRYPAMEVAQDFITQLERELLRRGTGKEDTILFLCRSGVRSLAAAQAMNGAGWRVSRNVSGGFEGPIDPDRHRGRVDGWKAAGLPWIQT
jgi:rhodanese-related sulfurtransferase